LASIFAIVGVTMDKKYSAAEKDLLATQP